MDTFGIASLNTQRSMLSSDRMALLTKVHFTPATLNAPMGHSAPPAVSVAVHALLERVAAKSEAGLRYLAGR